MAEFLFTEAELRSAAAAVNRSMLVSLPLPNQCPHTFSAEFERKINHLMIREERRSARRKALKQVAVVFLAILIGAGAWLTVDSDARAAFTRWVREVYENSSLYRYWGEQTAEVLPTYRPSELPVGYVETSVISDDTAHIIVYENNDTPSAAMVLMYSLMHENSNDQIFTTGTNEAITVHQHPGRFYLAGDEGRSNILLWLDEDAGITFSLSAFLPKDDMLHIAECVILCKPTK